MGDEEKGLEQRLHCRAMFAVPNLNMERAAEVRGSGSDMLAAHKGTKCCKGRFAVDEVIYEGQCGEVQSVVGWSRLDVVLCFEWMSLNE